MTTSLTYVVSEVPTIEIKAIRMGTPRVEFLMSCTPQSVDLTPDAGEYSDEQFYSDLRKASSWIDAMEKAALEEHAEGKTRKLP